MAVPDPPFSTPRIMKVLEPSAGQYEVIVRMDPTLASKFPDKPFGTAITEIGLAAKDTAKYAGYTLVSIEPADKGAKDHYWIFQKLDGPAWTTTSKSKDNLTPQKYRSQTVVVKTEQEVDPGTAPTTLAGNLVSSVVTQTPNTGKAVLSEVTETIDENTAPLVGQQAYEERQIANVSEIVVSDGAAVDSGNLIISSSVTPLGNGKSIKQTVSVPEWAEHLSSTWSDELMSQVTQIEKYTEPPNYSDLQLPNTSFKTINQDRSLRMTKVVPVDLLADVHIINEAESEVRLPDTLISVQVIVSRVLANSDSVGTGSTFSVGGTSAVALSADMTYELEEGYSGPVSAEIHVFYLPKDSVFKESVLLKCNALSFPRFRAKSNRVVISGHGMSKTVEQSNSNNGSSISESSSVTSLVNAIALPSSLHGDIEINVVYNDLTGPTGIASEYRDRINARTQEILTTRLAALATGARIFNLDTTIPDNATKVAALLASHADQLELQVTLNAVDFPVTVTPSSIPATDPPEVPTGRFLQSFRTTPYDYGYVQVSAVVITL